MGNPNSTIGPLLLKQDPKFIYNKNYELTSSTQPKIRICFLPCFSIIFPKKGDTTSIANGYPLNIIPNIDIGTPFSNASPGKKGVIDE
jgi:hypothetical protein